MAKRKAKRSGAKAKPFVCHVNRTGFAALHGVKPEDVDQRQLLKGVEVEMEHTRSRGRACGIALDHLAEHPAYYLVLGPAEQLMKNLERGTRRRRAKQEA